MWSEIWAEQSTADSLPPSAERPDRPDQPQRPALHSPPACTLVPLSVIEWRRHFPETSILFTSIGKSLRFWSQNKIGDLKIRKTNQKRNNSPASSGGRSGTDPRRRPDSTPLWRPSPSSSFGPTVARSQNGGPFSDLEKQKYSNCPNQGREWRPESPILYLRVAYFGPGDVILGPENLVKKWSFFVCVVVRVQQQQQEEQRRQWVWAPSKGWPLLLHQRGIPEPPDPFERPFEVEPPEAPWGR